MQQRLIGLGLSLALGQASGVSSPSVFDGGTWKLYTLPGSGDAGDLLGSGTIPIPAFAPVDSDGTRAKSGTWQLTATVNGTAQGLLIESADTLSKAWLTVTESGGGGDIIIDDDAVIIGNILTLTTLLFFVDVSDVLNNASFEIGWDGFTDGGGSTPTDVTRTTSRAYDGTTSVTRSLPVTGPFAITSNTKANPTVVFAPGSNIPTGKVVLISGNVGSSPDINGSHIATNVDANHFSIPVDTSGGSGGTGGTAAYDASAHFYFPFYDTPGVTLDRVWSRFYAYLDVAVDGILKFQIWGSTGFSEQFGGLFFSQGNVTWVFLTEDDGIAHILLPVSSIVSGWHSFEVDYWRNGDPSGFPSVAVWIDGVQITTGVIPIGSNAYWSQGRLIAGERDSSSKLGIVGMVGVLNAAPANTVPANIWVDRVSISSLGRIGP